MHQTDHQYIRKGSCSCGSCVIQPLIIYITFKCINCKEVYSNARIYDSNENMCDSVHFGTNVNHQTEISDLHYQKKILQEKVSMVLFR